MTTRCDLVGDAAYHHLGSNERDSVNGSIRRGKLSVLEPCLSSSQPQRSEPLLAFSLSPLSSLILSGSKVSSKETGNSGILRDFITRTVYHALITPSRENNFNICSDNISHFESYTTKHWFTDDPDAKNDFLIAKNLGECAVARFKL